jgi:hypothetical protein
MRWIVFLLIAVALLPALMVALALSVPSHPHHHAR